MALPRLGLQGFNFSIREFLTDSNYDLEPPYQRGLVWGLERKRQLIRSTLMGIPVGGVVINDRMSGGFDLDWGSDPVYAVVDGKQRLTTYREFVGSEFSIPAEWVEPAAIEASGDWVYFSDMGLPWQRQFKHNTIVVSMASVSTVEAEREIFELINFGGVPQGASDLVSVERND